MFKNKLEIIKEKAYLIIPIACVFMWALFNLIHNLLTINSFFIMNNDFYNYYLAGKQMLENPADLYDPKIRYYLLPVFAMVFAISISLFPLIVAQCIFYIFNLILAIMYTLEYNKILSLMGVKKKIHRFMFLMIISNGFIVYFMFYANQFKYISGLIIFYIIRRELHYRKEDKLKDLKFYLINYGLFAFAIATIPPFIFFLLIYLFQDIHISDIFKKYNIKKYGILIFMFLSQNFLIFIFPNYILDIIGLYGRWNKTDRGNYLPLFYLREWFVLEDYYLLIVISTVVTAIITIIFILNNSLKIEEKFGFFSIYCIIFFMFTQRGFIFLFALILLLFIPFLNQEEKGIEFLKKNRILLIGLLSISGIYLMIPNFTIFKYFPILEQYPYVIFINLRWIFLLCGLLGSLLILHTQMFKYNIVEEI